MRWSDIKIKPKLDRPKQNPDPAFVQRNLLPHVRNKGSKSWFVLCPFHPDRKSPSLSIVVNHGHKQSVGFWKCFGCGEKGYWNALAKALNMETLDGYKLDLTETAVLSFDTSEEEEEEPNSYKVNIKTLIPWPEERLWRGFSGKTVCKYGGMLNKFDADYPLVFLCKHRNSKKIIGFVSCRDRKKKGKKSYLHSPGTWISNYIWPEHKLVKTNSLVIVEGIRDALAWICRGIPTGAILGTQSGMGSRRKATLMGMNIDNVILFMDGDSAGENSVYGKWEDSQLLVEGLKSILEKDFSVKVFKTWRHFPESDPFKLAKNKKFVPKFKQWLEEHT